MAMSAQPTRRGFLKTGAATLGAAALGRVVPAQDPHRKLRLGFIGVGNRGGQLLEPCLSLDDVEIVALCDVYKPYLDKWHDRLEGKAEKVSDFRQLLERKDLDAVFIATPDHWHGLMTVMACDSGKDVYVEKPLSRTVFEGRRMVAAARRNNRIVQVGTQRRSSPIYAKLAEFVQSGGIGKVTVARCYRISNMSPDGIGRKPDSEPPADLDWDMWLGPRAWRPYNENIAPYKFRWWSDYSSQAGNWGVHYFDVIRWALGEKAPVSVSTHGGRFAIDDDRTIPDTMESILEMPSGSLVLFGQYEASSGSALLKGEVELRGTRGTIYASDNWFEVIPAEGGQFHKDALKIEPYKVESHSKEDITALHIRNFLDCVRTRQTPNADVEEGRLSTNFSLLANIALESRSRIEWHVADEKIINNEAAATMLHYQYREPWKLG
jgi:predicted dehydrogenase